MVKNKSQNRIRLPKLGGAHFMSTFRQTRAAQICDRFLLRESRNSGPEIKGGYGLRKSGLLSLKRRLVPSAATPSEQYELWCGFILMVQRQRGVDRRHHHVVSDEAVSDKVGFCRKWIIVVCLAVKMCLVAVISSCNRRLFGCVRIKTVKTQVIIKRFPTLSFVLIGFP